ncbi:MAG: hypothetical protein ACYDIC_19990 [Desulfobaccales bacterium]
MGLIFKIPAGIVYFVGGLWGLFVCLSIVSRELGFLGGAIGFFLLPVTLYFAPWYEAITYKNWFPVILVYGTTFVAAILYGIGALIDRD